MGDLTLRLLLDTHIWLWSLLEPEHLSRRVERELRSETNELWLSPISTWEILVLAEKGRVVLNVEARQWIEEALGAAPMREAPLTHEIVRASRRIHLPHQDPADRFLAATAKVLDLVLVTADSRLMGSKEFEVLPNR